jgi:ribosomal protein S27E
MRIKCYGVECFNCGKKIVIGRYTVENPNDKVDFTMPKSPIRCTSCGEGSVYVQDRLVYFFEAG